MTAFVSIERPVVLRWQSPAVERSADPSARVGPFARDSERFVIRLLIGGTKKPRLNPYPLIGAVWRERLSGSAVAFS